MTTSFVLLPNRRLATSTDTCTIKIWDTLNSSSSLVKILNIDNYTSRVTSMAVLQNGYLACGFENGVIAIWNPSNGLPINMFHEDTSVCSMVVLPNGDLASGHLNGTIYILDPINGLIHDILGGYEFGSFSSVCSMALLQNGYLVSGHSNGSIKIWNNQDRVSELIGANCAVTSLALLSNGHLASGCEDGSIMIWDNTILNVECFFPVRGGRKLYGNDYFGRILSLTSLADGQLACAFADNTIKIWDTYDGTLLRTILGGTDPVFKLALLIATYETYQVTASETETRRTESSVTNLHGVQNNNDDARLSESNCPICYEQFCTSAKKIVVTQCGHLFCKVCFEDWISICEGGKTCAYCKTQLYIEPIVIKKV